MDCNGFIQDEETVELIRAMDESLGTGVQPECVQRLGGLYEIDYYRKEDVPPLSLTEYSYESIPKVYGLLNLTSLEESGITALQNLSTLSLRGQGVLAAVIDTGIRYQDAAFRDAYGRTRIAAIWDQTANGTPPEGFLYGREYTREEIDEALRRKYTGEMVAPGLKDGTEESDRQDGTEEFDRQDEIDGNLENNEETEDIEDYISEVDENGHGTALASILAGSADAVNGFTGAAPEAELLVVKLRQAKRYLRDFFYVPEAADAYSEADLMAAVAYVDAKAREMGRPLVICIGVGSGSGGRTGSGVFEDQLGREAALRGRAVVCAAGNMANARRHFLGNAYSVLTPVRVELNVEADMEGLVVELWAMAPERFSVEVASPTGEVLSRVLTFGNADQEIDFVYEGTRLTVSYREASRYGQNLLIFFRFSQIVRGVWTIRVYPEVTIAGRFDLWLPMAELSMGEAYFLMPNPDTTLTTPADALIPISVGGYDASSGAVWLDSGRGYTVGGAVKPDFLAPAVRITARGLRDNYVTFTGTSAAAALTAGACTQLLEWAVVKGNRPDVNSVDLKNLLIRGSHRENGQVYPSPERGYGKLDVAQALENLRGK